MQNQTETYKNQGTFDKLMKIVSDNQKSNKLNQGIDLTNFGLDLNDNNKKLFETFSYPFHDQPARKTDPMNFKIPSCYTKPQLQLKKDLIKKVPKETLFYIFYNVPEEQYQQWAVEQLYEEKWQYNYQLQTFFQDIKSLGGGKYSCKYFDIEKWKVQELDSIEFDLDKDFLALNQFSQEKL
ncbi:hypothetical protein PPERSA_12839 [Pseudocohnilembus persalinus]|uniref:NOT2/NOT3/NOT5 C-terminal domain-containing protein n=1 Tax=Pseudocohnilembus persalinus TaxID=266149 RepID=A0A0V0QEI6_PSEPJ|nr:hypothetical protein PPERSA_12839 [Pseudocohnilembus persalinus]|eukprot:KRX00620.1 hypothetical protein PPERSA_12839 [Pseudocohnilembus persalinus]